MPVTVQVMHAERGLDSLADVWRDLARETDAGPFQSYEWASSWWSAFGGDLHLAPVLVRRDGAVRGLVPLVARAAPEGGEELVFLGTGMSDLLDWILTPDLDPRAVLDGLFDAFDRIGVTAVDLRDMPETSSLLRTLRDTTPGDRVGVCHPCPVVDLPASPGVYLAGRSRNLRESLRKSRKRAAERGVGPLVAHDSPDSCRRALDAFFPPHVAWWGRRGVRPLLGTEAPRRFLQTALPLLAASGSAEISCRHCGPELVSAFVIMRHRRTRYYYQAALNPAYADLSPGTAHMAAEITRAIHDGMTTLDLLRGDEPYKSRWSTSTRHTHRFTTSLPR